MDTGTAVVRTAVALRESQGRWLLPDTLARTVGLTDDDFRSAIRSLRQRGFRIDVRPGGALRLAIGPDGLDASEITEGLNTRTIGGAVDVLDEVGSTNDVAWERLSAGAVDGICVAAESQTAGRGRQGRRWIAPRGTSVLLSVGVTPGLEMSQASVLTFAASVAVVEAIRSATGVAAEIEWPNDVVCGAHKVAGILVEGRRIRPGAGPAASAFVIGAGINVNVARGALPADVRESATSLSAESGRPVDRIVLIRHLLRSLDTWYGVLRGGDVALIGRRWLALSATVGRMLVIEQGGRRFEGTVVDVSPEDGLAMRLGHGEIRHFRAHAATVAGRTPGR